MDLRKKVDWVAIRNHVILLIVCACFYFIWGQWKWRTAEFGTQEWWFDNLGHTIGGVIIARQLLYEVEYFFPTVIYRRVLTWAIPYLIIPAAALLLALGWETGEMYHDYPWYALQQAQKGGADTTIDIIITVFFAYGTILIKRQLVDRLREKLHPDETKEIELRARIAVWHEDGIAIKRELRLLHRMRSKDLRRKFWDSAKEFLHQDDGGGDDDD